MSDLQNRDAINREQAVLYKDHAFLRDCCIRFPGFVLHLYEEKQGSMERRAITEFNMKDFYCLSTMTNQL